MASNISDRGDHEPTIHNIEIQKRRDETRKIMREAFRAEAMAQAADTPVNKLLTENQQLKDRIRLLEAIPEAMYADLGDGHRFTDLLGRMNPLHWHYCNITVRINGEDKHYEGDWLKQVYIAREKARII